MFWAVSEAAGSVSGGRLFRMQEICKCFGILIADMESAKTTRFITVFTFLTWSRRGRNAKCRSFVSVWGSFRSSRVCVGRATFQNAGDL